jgi:hypothetical protein
MRHLLQPRVLQAAGIAAVISTLACYPRLSLWLQRPAPIWYLEITIFVSCVMLWGFVFAWHEPYTGRPVFVFKMDLLPLMVATLAGLAAAAAHHAWVDPVMRSKFPEEYPADLEHWLATVPFVLAFNQLFVLFAPFDWLMRLAKNRWLATSATGLLAAALLLLKAHTLAVPLAPSLLGLLLVARVAAAFLVVWFYLRGGVLLVSWWAFLLECRHLLDFTGPGSAG